MDLANKKCVPCHGGVPLLNEVEFSRLLREIPGWQVQSSKKLVKVYILPNFKKAMELANRVADLAEQEGHHPDLLVKWGELHVEIWTHAINGLSENDFILAAKIEQAAHHLS